jgi:hypothetical protein
MLLGVGCPIVARRAARSAPHHFRRTSNCSRRRPLGAALRGLPRPTGRGEAIDGFRIETWRSGLSVRWRSRWTGEQADALIGTARAAASALRRAEVQRRREKQRRIVALQTADLLATLDRRRAEVLGAGSGRSEPLSPGATGSRPGR